MGRIDTSIIQKGEGTTLKIVKYKGTTQIEKESEIGIAHTHNFVVYTDDTVEILEHIHIDEEGIQHKHRHKYIGEYPNGYIVEDHQDHVHTIISVYHPIELKKKIIGK